MNSESGVSWLPKKKPTSYPWWYGLVPTLVLSFVLFAVFGVPKILDAYKEKVPPTEVERFISGDALVKDGVRVWIHTDRDHNFRTYTERGDVPGLTEIWNWLRAQGYHKPGETDVYAPGDTVWCSFGRLHGDFCLECTRLVSTENPKSYGVGMELNLKTHEHLGEGVNFEGFQQAYPKAVKDLSQSRTVPAVKG